MTRVLGRVSVADMEKGRNVKITATLRPQYGNITTEGLVVSSSESEVNNYMAYSRHTSKNVS